MKNLLAYGFIMSCLILSSCLGVKNTNTGNTEASQGKQNNPASGSSSSKDFFPARKMSVNHQTFENGDKIRVFLELDIPRLSQKDGLKALQEEFIFNYGILKSYTSKEFVETKKINVSQVRKGDGLYYLTFDLNKRPLTSAVLIMDIVDTKSGQKILHDLPINFTVTKVREKFGAFDKSGQFPHFSSYLLTEDTIMVRDLQNTPTELTVRYYSEELEPALPPMSTDKSPLSPIRNLQSDSTFLIKTNQALNFKKTGLYLLNVDTSNYYGISLYVSDRRYPKLTKINDVIDPLVYITTAEEINKLQATSDTADFAATKRQLDLLWIELTKGNIQVAKQTIREYFRRVKMANKFFTTHKPGWKTDMGMIYVIFGRPNRIRRNNNSEHWFYTQNTSFSEIKFSFLRKPTQFSDDHYELLRYPEYEQIWYPIIEQWREGKIQ